MLGDAMKLYIGDGLVEAEGSSGGSGSAIGEVTWTEVTCVKDVNLNPEAEDVDTSTRAGRPYKSHDAGLIDAIIEVELEWKPTDSGFQALKDAFLARSAIAIACADGAIDGVCEAFVGNFKVLTFPRQEPLTGHVTGSVQLALHSAGQWYEGTA